MIMMSFKLNRINPNQTQVMFADGRFETLTDEELEDFMLQVAVTEKDAANLDLAN